ncbi:MAG: energy-coupling factor transporter transmembrane component T [Candidatus Limnocylindria bacterium]
MIGSGDSRPEAPAFVQPLPTGPYRSLNPTTKLVVAVCEALIAFSVRGWTGPLAMLAVLGLTAFVARLGRSLVPFLFATLPITASILLVNTFLFPGATDRILTIGPFAPTWTGLQAAVQATLRVVAFAMSVAVLVLTTRPDELVADLELRGAPRGVTFVIGTTVRTIPRIVQRAREITDAQRARGLDTEGRLLRRVRGVLPLAAPLVFGSLNEVEEQTMALEARAFSSSGRRTPLRAFPDGAAQRWLRGGLALGTAALIVLSVAGLLAGLP